MLKKVLLLSLAFIIQLSVIWDNPKIHAEFQQVNAEYQLCQGMSWEATRFDSGKIVDYENFIVTGSRQWNGEEVWEIQGYVNPYGGSDDGSIEKIEETIFLAKDLTLRYCEWKYFYEGTGKSIKIICERIGKSYHHSIFTNYFNLERLYQEQDIPCDEPVFLCEGLFVQLALLVESGKLTETKECFILDPYYILKKEYPIRKFVTGKKQADHLRLPGSIQDLNCNSVIINGNAGQIYYDILGKMLAFRFGGGSKKIVYLGNYVK